MYLTVFYVLLLFKSVYLLKLSQLRWCYITSSQSGLDGAWREYNDSKSICSTCAEETKLFVDVLVSNQKYIECCDNKEFKQDCPKTTCDISISCKNVKSSYCKSNFCDGYNDCGDGSDEIAIKDTLYPSESCFSCSKGTFKCRNPKDVKNPKIQCFKPTMVCDGKKDCFTGSDEENCLYYGGRCPGFLCTTFTECIGKTKVCDGVKDCLDGSDEEGCYTQDNSCSHENLFTCDNGASKVDKPSTDRNQIFSCDPQVVINSRVCDGQSDCDNGKDEENCFNWSEWTSWSHCQCDEDTHFSSRTRRCFTFRKFFENQEGKCFGLSKETIHNCSCETTATISITKTQQNDNTASISDTVLTVIILSAVIIIIILSCLVYIIYVARIREKEPQEVLTNLHPIQIDPKYRSNYSADKISNLSYPLQSSTYPFHPMGYATNKSNTSSQYPTLNNRKQDPLPPTPTDSIYASIDEIDPYAQTPLGNRSISLVSIDQIANPQAVVRTPYDIPKSSGVDVQRSKKAGSRLIRAISRKVIGKQILRKSQSTDQLNQSFKSTRNKLLKFHFESDVSLNDDHNPASNYMSMCGRASSSDSFSAPFKNEVIPGPPLISAPKPTGVFKSSSKSKKNKKELKDHASEQATRHNYITQLKDTQKIYKSKSSVEDRTKFTPVYSKVIPKSMRRKLSFQHPKPTAESSSNDSSNPNSWFVLE